MPSAFASQLQTIAANSTHELDLKARRNAHGESLLFERDVAVKQDFETIYNICSEGYRELCLLDDRFRDFERNLFSEQAKDQDREQLTKAENEALELVLRRCLMMLSGRLLLRPAVKCLEWLIRRFRVHVHDVDVLLCAVLPYHEVGIWANVLSIVASEKVVGVWKWCRPYLKTTWNVPRHAVAYAFSNNDGFFSLVNRYVLDACAQALGDNSLVRFWSSIIVEAINNRLSQTRSGRKEIQGQRTEDLLHKVLPLLSEGYEVHGSTDLITTCYTITIVLVAKAELDDRVLDSLMLAVSQSLTRADHDAQAAFITLTVIISHKRESRVPKSVLNILADMEALSMVVHRVSKQHPCRTLLVALVKSTIPHIKRSNVHKRAAFIEELIRLIHDLYPSQSVEAVQPVVSKIIKLNAENELESLVRDQLIARLQTLSEVEAISKAVADAAKNEKHDPAMLEDLLGMTISLPEPAKTIEPMDKDQMEIDSAPSTYDSLLASVPRMWKDGLSCFSIQISSSFDKLVKAFEVCSSTDKIGEFSSLPIWSSVGGQALLWQTFLLRFACTNASSQARVKALQLLLKSLQESPATSLQIFVPYALVLLSDVKPIRRSAAKLLDHIQNTTQQANSQPANIYGSDVSHKILPLPDHQIESLLKDVISPVVEECVLDQEYVLKTVRDALQSSSYDHKKSHKQALFNLLTQHALATPLVKVKVRILSMLEGTQKVGAKSRTKTLQPMLQEWSQLSAGDAQNLASEAGLQLRDIDASFVSLVDLNDKHFLEHFVESAMNSASTYRTELVFALFDHIRRNWTIWTLNQQSSIVEVLFGLAIDSHEALAAGAQDVLRSVDLRSEILASLLQQSQAGTSEVRLPSAKRRRRSSSNGSISRGDALKSIDNATARIGFALELVDSNDSANKPELIGNMFELLQALKQLQQNRIDAPYLLNLCLSNVGNMTKSAKSMGKSINVNEARPELVVDILRAADNPQVQNSALLVLASLSTIVPDKMVHNVMPIFTFIGNNMLSKDDEHSINVINEAIDKIVPALLDNLRRGRNPQSYQSSIAAMLVSFTSAYEHIPMHRRVIFYQKLLHCINAEECGYMLVALLADNRRNDASIMKFTQDLVSNLPAFVQLKIYQQLLQVAVDAISSSPKVAATLFSILKSTTTAEKQRYSVSCLKAASTILQTPKLVSDMQRTSRSHNDQADHCKTQLQSAFKVTLSTIRATKTANDKSIALIRQSMDYLLQLPSLPDLLESLYAILDDMEPELRPQALRVLAMQFNTKKTSNSRAREMAMRVLEKLNGYLVAGSDDALLQASMVCIDEIAEAYGRKAPDQITASAQHILEHVGLYQHTAPGKRANAVNLTMASLIEVLKEAAVPLIPQILQQVLVALDKLAGRHDSDAIFAAIYTLLSAVFAYTPFMVSEQQLPQLWTAIVVPHSLSADVEYSNLKRTIARKVELESIMEAALQLVTTGADSRLLSETLALVDLAIDASPKPTVVKSADSISQLFQNVLEAESHAVFRHQQLKKKEEYISPVAKQLKDVTIKFIYKINDRTFRPIFESWVDWSTSLGHTLDTNEASRQIVLFDYLTHFFDTLKAIVTSYASYLLKPVHTILGSAILATSTHASTYPASISLLTNTLSMLKTIATHDQDAFFTAPSHFDTICGPLSDCLKLAALKSTRTLVSDHVIPAVVALATSTVDSPSTHAQLTSHVVKLKSHSSSHVRLASIQTLIALSEDEELSEEYIANVVGVGAGEGEGARGGSVGEIMVYVNEMLEDDDENVEHEVRRWVQMVRAKVGEDVFEV